ncbi:hypothetical protein Lal_00026495 [Lupinus albus]|uniref:Uncharacterized protein n=1 Tax=Lupinus albus TaxID=3870 RepID=A0A6A5LTN3_LUPAL|nr:hypothetical protein Lalb_Chr09g0324801 [Lupinus albus]KAF1861992.1 hypothetical protein Lal_00026495 [Lupinus albus]
MAVTSLSSSIIMANNPETQFMSGSLLKPMDKCFLKINSSQHFMGSSVRAKTARNLPLVVRAGGDGGRPSGGSIFVGGFVLGGIIVGALGCVYAPQISRVLAGADSKDFMKKLPKFMYDEEKALEKTRKVLTEKIAQLSSAIDGVSAQLRTDDGQNESAEKTEETEVPIYD